MNQVAQKKQFEVQNVLITIDASDGPKRYILTGGTEAERERVAIYLATEGYIGHDEKVSF